MRRGLVAIGISLVVFAFMQLLFGGTPCFDCGAMVGFPLAYRQEGTYGTLGRFIWLGFLGDCAVSITVSALAVWMWRRGKVSKKGSIA
jgi:hypothetical protein